MSTRDLILIMVAIIISGVIIGGCVLIASEPQNNDSNVTAVNNNTTNNTTQLNTSTGEDTGYTYSKQSDSYVKNNGETYDTGSKDSNGEKIYAHRYAKDGWVYETYKSASGREIDPNEYYA